MCAPTTIYLLVANYKFVHMNKKSEHNFYF
jgi:hypothetical protein